MVAFTFILTILLVLKLTLKVSQHHRLLGKYINEVRILSSDSHVYTRQPVSDILNHLSVVLHATKYYLLLWRLELCVFQLARNGTGTLERTDGGGATGSQSVTVHGQLHDRYRKLLCGQTLMNARKPMNCVGSSSCTLCNFN